MKKSQDNRLTRIVRQAKVKVKCIFTFKSRKESKVQQNQARSRETNKDAKSQGKNTGKTLEF